MSTTTNDQQVENWQMQELDGRSLLDFTTEHAANGMRKLWERDYQRPFRVRQTHPTTTTEKRTA